MAGWIPLSLGNKESWPSFWPVGPTARREDQALVGPWKGLFTIAGVETQKSEGRSQNRMMSLRAYTFYIF